MFDRALGIILVLPIIATGASEIAVAQRGDACPGAGSCFVPHGNPGCSDPVCCGQVCAQDEDCCRFEWDSLCVGRAESVCTSTCPSEGSCFSVHGNPGCDDAECCNNVCGYEPLCCELDWDSQCVSAANDLCATGPCPGSGSCFLPHATPGCDDAACCGSVCEADSECCTGPWDSLCVQRAREVCGCSGVGNCFAAKPTPSCDNDACCSLVCAQDAACCESEWDCRCAETALSLCSPQTCPADGSCFGPHSSGGCSDDACCSSVCLIDPECCLLGWDSLCVERALDVCPNCPGTGNCLTAHESRGCESADCCSQVCEADPWCCKVEWDWLCVGLAEQLCTTPACPGSGSCFGQHATPGCNRESCCNEVCLLDPECCTGPWDSFCVDRARDVCSACPSQGRCDTSHLAPGCEDSNCCQNVCKILPRCCLEGWDLQCARIARQECRDPACPGNGSCYEVHSPSPGCEDPQCCNTVCQQDPNCCGLEGWDSLCVARALNVCRTPSNDDPDDSIPMACSEVHLGSTIGATDDGNVVQCGAAIGAVGVWYRAIGTGFPMTVDTCDPRTRYNTRVSVYTGECGRDLSCVAGGDNDCFLQTSVTWESNEGERYWILVHGGNGQTGEFALRLLCQSGCPAGPVAWLDPPNEVVDGRQPYALQLVYQPQGITRFVVEAPRGAGPDCWSLCNTRQGVVENAVANVVEVDGVYTLTLAQPIAAGELTSINYGGFAGSATGRFSAHPGNVGGDGVVGPMQALRMVGCLNENSRKSQCPWGFPYSQDIDQSGGLTPADLLRVIDLIQGADYFEPWNGTVRPTNTSCP